MILKLREESIKVDSENFESLSRSVTSDMLKPAHAALWEMIVNIQEFF